MVLVHPGSSLHCDVAVVTPDIEFRGVESASKTPEATMMVADCPPRQENCVGGDRDLEHLNTSIIGFKLFHSNLFGRLRRPTLFQRSTRPEDKFEPKGEMQSRINLLLNAAG